MQQREADVSSGGRVGEGVRQGAAPEGISRREGPAGSTEAHVLGWQYRWRRGWQLQARRQLAVQERYLRQPAGQLVLLCRHALLPCQPALTLC